MRRIFLVLMMGIFQIGLSLFLFPVWNRIMVNQQIGKTTQDFQSTIQTQTVETTEAEPNQERREYARLWEAMQEYNAQLFEEGQIHLDSPQDYTVPSFSLKEYGLKEDVFGVITIPAIQVEMPIYLGATESHLAAGAAHLSQTSLPIGGDNTNCVMAGHRGWNGFPYFRYITDLKQGDQVTIQNPWETLEYEVVETKIIAPNDIEEIHIQEGRELLTLLTCHPYASGGKQRYLVICERVNQEEMYG